MNIQTVFEIGTQTAWRYWRYAFRGGQLQLLSWRIELSWPSHQSIEANASPDRINRGIHGFKSEQEMWCSFSRNLPHMVRWSKLYGGDGIVFGTVEMWGIVWDHEKGYRAQFARPLSFDACHGRLDELALAELRANFFSRAAEVSDDVSA